MTPGTPVAQDELSEDAERVRAYGAAHADVWAGMRFSQVHDGARLVAGFTRDLDDHAGRLRRRLARPDRLDVVALPASAVDLERIRERLAAHLGSPPDGPLRSVGLGFGTVAVTLAPWAVADAGALVDRYGEAVDVTVGAFPYPLDRHGALPGPVGRPLPPLVAIEGLEVRLELGFSALPSGRTGEGHVVVANHGETHVELSTGVPLLPVVWDLVRDRAVGGYTGVVRMVLRRLALGAGDEASLRVLVGTDSLDPALGYAVPPGEYRLRAFLPLRPGADAGAVRVPEVPLVVVPDRS